MSSPAVSSSPRSLAPAPDHTTTLECDQLPAHSSPSSTPAPLPTPPEPVSPSGSPSPISAKPTVGPHVSRKIRALLAKAHAQTLKFATRTAARHLHGAIGVATGQQSGFRPHSPKALLDHEVLIHNQRDEIDTRATDTAQESRHRESWPDPPSPPLLAELGPAVAGADAREDPLEMNDAQCLICAVLIAALFLRSRQTLSPSPPCTHHQSSVTPPSLDNDKAAATDEKLDQILSMMSDLGYAIASLQQQILVMDARHQHTHAHLSLSSSSASSTITRGRSLSPHHLVSSSPVASFPTPPGSRRTSVSTTLSRTDAAPPNTTTRAFPDSQSAAAAPTAQFSSAAVLAAKRAGKFLVPARRRLSMSSAASSASDRRDSTSSIDSALHSPHVPMIPSAWPAGKARDSACFPESSAANTGTDTDTDGPLTPASELPPLIKRRGNSGGPRRSTLASRLNMPTPLPEVAELSLSVASSLSNVAGPSKSSAARGSMSTSASAVAHLIDRFQAMSPPSAGPLPASPRSPEPNSTSSTPTPSKARRRSSGGMVAQLIAAFSSSSSSSSSSSNSNTPSTSKTSTSTTPRLIDPPTPIQPRTPPPTLAGARGPPSVHSRASSACSLLLGPIAEEEAEEDAVAPLSCRTLAVGSSGSEGDDSFTRRSKIMSPNLIRMTQQLIDEEEMDVVRMHMDVFDGHWSATDEDEPMDDDGWWDRGRGIEYYFAPEYDHGAEYDDSMSVVSDPLDDMDDREPYVPLDEMSLLLEEPDVASDDSNVTKGESSKESMVSPPLLPQTPTPDTCPAKTSVRPTSSCSSDGKLDESNRESYPWHVHPLDRESNCCNVHHLLKSQRVPVSPFASKFASPVHTQGASRRASTSVVEMASRQPLSPSPLATPSRANDRTRSDRPGAARNSVSVLQTPRTVASPQPSSGTSRKDALEALSTPRRQQLNTPTRVMTPTTPATTPRAQHRMSSMHTTPHTPSPTSRRPRSSLAATPASLQQPIPTRPVPNARAPGYVKSVAETLAAGMAVRTASPRSAVHHGHAGVHLAATPPSMVSYGRSAATTSTSLSGSSGSSRRSSITSYSSLRHLANVSVAQQPRQRAMSQAPAPAPSSRAKPIVRAFRA